MKLPRGWGAIRKAALLRAGYRSSRSGLAGRLECHHKDGNRANNDPENLEVLLRSEHILEHYTPDPDRLKWRQYLETTT